MSAYNPSLHLKTAAGRMVRVGCGIQLSNFWTRCREGAHIARPPGRLKSVPSHAHITLQPSQEHLSTNKNLAAQRWGRPHSIDRASASGDHAHMPKQPRSIFYSDPLRPMAWLQHPQHPDGLRAHLRVCIRALYLFIQPGDTSHLFPSLTASGPPPQTHSDP